MNILALNTAFGETYIGVLAGDKKVFKSMDSSLKQSENVLGLIDAALLEVQTDIRELDVISCVIGPGSFTGIRIGASLAKGFCTACSSIKRIGINSLDLLAFIYSKNATSNFWVILNALSGNLFCCKFNSKGERLVEPQMVFGDKISEITGTVVGLKDENLDICNVYAEFTSESLLDYTLLLVSQEKFSDFVPLYLRKSQAEAELDKKDANS